jgi:CheY-like chemotaxis protein
VAVQIPDTISRDSTILVVDDIAAARRVVVRMLGILGFTNILEAQNSSEAMAKIKSREITLVITDLHLKDSLGTDLLIETRNDANIAQKHIPFIIVTSDMDKESFKHAIQAGVSSYLLKPFTPDSLAERLVATLHKTEIN